jgi:hypothetical protein
MCNKFENCSKSFYKVLSKKPNFAKYENRLQFFLEDLKRKPNFAKYKNCFHFCKGSFKDTQPFAKHENHLVFSRVLSNIPDLVLCFCLKFLSFWFFVSYKGKKGSLNIQHYNFSLAL